MSKFDMCDPCDTVERILGRLFIEDALIVLFFWLLPVELCEVIRRIGSAIIVVGSSVDIHFPETSSSVGSCPLALGVMWPKEKGKSGSPWKFCVPSAVVASHNEPLRSVGTV